MMNYILLGLCVFFACCILWQSLRAGAYRLDIEMLKHRNDTLAKIIEKQSRKASQEARRPTYDHMGARTFEEEGPIHGYAVTERPLKKRVVD